MYIKRLFLISFIFFMAGHGLQAQPQYPFRQYTIADGLPQMQVTSVTQNRLGYIWVTTRGGVSSFNGEQFTNYTFSDGLPSKYYFNLAEDSKARMWASRQDHFVCFDGAKFAVYDTKGWKAGEDCYVDNEDRIWAIGRKEDSIERISFRTDEGIRTHPWPAGLTDTFNRSSYIPYVFGNASQSWQYLVNPNSLKVYSIKSGELRFLKHIKNAWFLKISNYCNDHGFWFAELQPDESVVIYSLKDGAIRQLCALPVGTLNFCPAKTGYYFITKQNGVEWLSWDGKTKRIFGNKLTTSFYQMYSDRDDRLWIASETGLWRLSSKAFVSFPEIELPSVWSLIEGRDGMIYAGSWNEKCLYRIDGQDKVSRVEGLPEALFSFGPSLIGDTIVYPCGDRLVMYRNGQLTTLEDTLCVFSLFDPKRNLLLTDHVGSLRIYDRNMKVLRHLQGGTDTPAMNYILGMAIDPDGNYWCISGSGVYRYNYESKKVTPFIQTIHENQYLGGSSIYADSFGGIWAGSPAGLFHFNPSLNLFEKVASEAIRSTVSFLHQVNQKSLWIGTIEGLYILDLDAFYSLREINVQLFNSNNGLDGLECGQNGIMQDSRGYVWMTTSNVVCRVDPAQLKRNSGKLRPYIIGLDNEILPYTERDAAQILPYGDNQFNFRFEAVGFSRPLHTEFQYLLEGRDKQWSEWTTEHQAYYQGLGSGWYTFRLRTRTAGLDNGIPSETVQEIRVRVPFWREPYFYPLAALVFSFLLGVALYYLYLAYRRRAKLAERERQVRYLQIQTLQSQINTHFLFNTLGTLQKAIDPVQFPEAEAVIIDFAQLVRRYLEASINSDSPHNTVFGNQVSLWDELELVELYLRFEAKQAKHPLDWDIQVPVEIWQQEPNIPPLLIQPFVENSVKWGLSHKNGPGKVQIRVDRAGSQRLRCTIEDNGIGLSEAKSLSEHSHLVFKPRGTSLVRERIKILNLQGYNILLEPPADRPSGGVTVSLEWGAMV